VGTGKGPVSNTTAENSQASLATNLSNLLTTQEGNSQQLFNTAFPAYSQATDFFSALASGSPDLIQKVIAPAAQQINQATAGAKQNILQTSPAGGERNLAISEADVNQGKAIGDLAAQGYTGSFNSLAQLGASGIGASQGAAGTAIGAGQASSADWSQIFQQNIQQKGAQLGAFGGLGSDVASLGGAAIGAHGAEKGGAALGAALA
jgi:hypothetical protein